MKSLYTLVILLMGLQLIGQEKDKEALFIKEIYDYSLTESKAYQWLHDLSEGIGGRLAGSPQAAAAVEYTGQIMESLGIDTVKYQECDVPHWTRGKRSVVRIVNSPSYGSYTLKSLTLGNSIGTGDHGVVGEVIELQNLNELEDWGPKIKDKIVFFNRPMDNKQFRTFNAYGGAVDQRVFGPARAAKYGAKAVIVRSMTTRLDDVPHTGSTVYEEHCPKIPGVAISTNDAELLSKLLKKEKVSLYVENHSQNHLKKKSYNVIGEIKGSQYPNEIILVGGHLDSWDVGGGAHDDGAGCVHSLQVIETLLALDYVPKRTIRCVMFMNEENGLAGGLEYAKKSNERGEFHLAAIESDAGGFSPRGFSCDADTSVFKKLYGQVVQWSPILETYGLSLSKGGSGADINPLKSQKGILIGLRPDSQRYFDYHHTEIDRIDAVNKRELDLGAAAMTALVYLLDKNGLERN